MHICNKLIFIRIENLGNQTLKILLSKAVESFARNNSVRVVSQVPNALLKLIAEAQNRGNFVVFGLKIEKDG